MANPLYDNLISKNSNKNSCFLEQSGKEVVSFYQFSKRSNNVAIMLTDKQIRDARLSAPAHRPSLTQLVYDKSAALRCKVF